jgi:metallo-beta-lactamase family protein
MATLTFFGAAGTVTGSRTLVTTEHARVLVDCGLFQGGRALKDLNWQPLPVDPLAIDSIVLTHAHLDHSGYLPRLIADGYFGQVHVTPGTADLLGILLPDAGHLQEEEAEHANRKGWSRHQPAMPLFTVADAEKVLERLVKVPYRERTRIAEGVSVTLHPAGHIIGSSLVEMTIEESTGKTTVVFSGDLGKGGPALLAAPTTIEWADAIVIESTYGDRLQSAAHATEDLGNLVRRAVDRGGMLVVPSFAVGRTQEILFRLRELEDADAIPLLDVFVDSPMALDATAITLRHVEDFNPVARARMEAHEAPLCPRKLHLVRDVETSKAINMLTGPGIILSASGMCTGGRIKHHLKRRLPDERNTIGFVGYQAEGTLGRTLQSGAAQVYIHGEDVPVRAVVETVDGFSAHADQEGLMNWLRGFIQPPMHLVINHGEPHAAQELAGRAHRELGWNITVAELGQEIAVVQPPRIKRATAPLGMRPTLG